MFLNVIYVKFSYNNLNHQCCISENRPFNTFYNRTTAKNSHTSVILVPVGNGLFPKIDVIMVMKTQRIIKIPKHDI